MIADTLGSVLLYAVVSTGLAWPLATRLTIPAAEKLLASAALSLVGVFLLAWAVYVWALPRPLLWALPVGAVAALLAGWRSLREMGRDADARELIIAQAIVTAWCVGWLALIVTYSGGGWVADWFGHWQRVSFFLEHGPRDILFNGFDPLTSRPPLANVVIGALLAVTRIDFAHYQLATTVLGSLVFLPAAVLARQFQSVAGCGGPGGAPHVVRVVAVGFMLNPMFVQNATFAWTKLPAAFFTLAALHYFLRTRERDHTHAGPLCALTLGAALLTHYSAGPYAVILAVAWLIGGWARRRDAAWWQATALAGATGAVLLATWFGWALPVYGLKGTFLTNTSVTDQAPGLGAQLSVALLNVRDTLVPHFLRAVDYGFIAQKSPWGWWRDWFFQLYQVNFFFMFGSAAWLVTAVALVQRGRSSPLRGRTGWTLAIASTAALGIMVHAGRDTWGLAHICLQPLVLVGLAFLASHWESLGRGWRWTLVAGAVADFAFGLALQFGAQSFLLDQWLAPHRAPGETLASYSGPALINLRAKLQSKWSFFGDAWAAHDVMILGLLGALLLLAIFRVTQRRARA